MHLEFTVLGVPVGQPRVRACIRGRHAGVYDPGTADAWKAAIRAKISEVSKWHFGDAAVSVVLTFYMPRPKSHFNAKGVLKPSAPWRHVSKPDLDNLVKAALDAITASGQVWNDDAQVCILMAFRDYADNGTNPPQMHCQIKPIRV